MTENNPTRIQRLYVLRREFGSDRRLRQLAAHADELSDRGSALLQTWQDEVRDRRWTCEEIL